MSASSPALPLSTAAASRATISGLGLLVGLACAAFAPDAAATSSKQLALGAVAFAVAAWRLPHWWRRPTLSSGAYLWLMGCAWSLVTLLWSSAPAPLVALPFVAGAALLLAATSFPLAERRHAAETAAVTALGATLLVRGLSDPPFVAGHGNANWLGLAVAPWLTLAASAAHRRAGAGRVVAVLATLGGLYLLYESRSRAAVVGLGAAMLVALPGRSKALAAAPAMGLWFFDRGAWEQALAGRVWIWQTAADAIEPGGSGLGGFSAAYLEAQGARLATFEPHAAALRFVHAESAHHDALQWLVVGGPIAAVLFVSAMVSGAWRHRRTWRGGTAALVTILVAGLADIPAQLPAGIATVGLVLAAAPAVRSRGSRGLERMQGLAVLVALAALLPAAVRHWGAERALTQWRRASKPSPVALDRWVELTPENGELRLARGTARALDPRRAASALEDLLVAERFSPGQSASIAVGHAHLALGDPHAAVLAYRRVLAMHPASFRGALALARAELSRDELDRAEEALKRAAALRPADPAVVELTETLRRARIDQATR